MKFIKSYLENIGNKTKCIIILNLIFAIINILMQFYISFFYTSNLPIPLSFLESLLLILYLFISIFSLFNIAKLEIASKSLEDVQNHNKNLKNLNDRLRIFKHDFSNIIQCLGGYIINDDMNGLKKYYNTLKAECNSLNTLSILDSRLVDDPALYSLITAKYELAEQSNVSLNVNISACFSEMNVTPYVLTRILGILLDNAIEAARNSKEKRISLSVFSTPNTLNSKKHVIEIENSYSNKDVDVEKIREKGYTSKNSEEGSHGLGLWEVNKILQRNKNLNLYTTKNDDSFTQQFEIFA